MSIYHEPYISILGDSISTLVGYTPAESVFYDPTYARSTGVTSAEDTWWMKVIHGLGGQLLVNNSYAGSTISMKGYRPAAAFSRIRMLETQEARPDYILVYSGLNDVASRVEPEDFYRYYLEMLRQLKTQYPQAEIWCGTLTRGFQVNPDFPSFFNWNDCLPLSEYNNGIRRAVSETGCLLADLDAFSLPHATFDSAHPNTEGMTTLSELWLRCIKK